MSSKKILLKGRTRMSLHERFSFLRSQSAAAPSSSTQTVQMQSVRPSFLSNPQATLKNRRLAQMMDRRPTVQAALRVKKQILKQRLGLPQQRLGLLQQRLSVKDRLTLRGRLRGGLRGRVGQRGSTIGRSPLLRQQMRGLGRGNRRGARGTFSRSQSMTNLSRSQSMQSLRGRQSYNTEGTSRGRGRFFNKNYVDRQDFRRGVRGFRSRGGAFYRNREDFGNRRGGRGFYNTRGGQRSRGFRSRGGGRGRGRGGSGPVPTREELDSQLDQYMATSRHELDRQLDKYMNNQESWD